MKYWFHRLMCGLLTFGLLSNNVVYAQITHHNQSSQTVAFGVEKISEFVNNQIYKNLGLYSHVAKGSNVTDTGILLDWQNTDECVNGHKPDKCEWLARNKHKYSASAVKKTEKAWGCRHSRASKGKKA